MENSLTEFSPEAEQSVLGAVLLDSSYLNIALNILPNNDFFYLPDNKIIYETIINMFSSGKKIDYVTVLENLPVDSAKKNELKNYMLDIVQIVPSISNIESYAKIIQDKYELRSLISLAREILQESTSSESTDKLLDFAEQKIIDIRNKKSSKSIVSANDILAEMLISIDKLNSNGKINSGILTGFKDLDSIISGLNCSDLILIAARPGMGKTSFALNIAKCVSEQNKTIFFSLEMNKEQLMSRVLSMESKIPCSKLKNGDLGTKEFDKITKSTNYLSNCKLYIDDSPKITVNEIKAKIRRLGNVSIAIIDYLQLISSSRQVSNRVQEISEITRQLKIMAKELNIPVICLSQLSRASEQRIDHRPLLSDLRDSGSIEQDADIVIMLYRDRYYNPKDERIDPNECECIIAKNRHGETGSINLHWEPEYTRFTNI